MGGGRYYKPSAAIQSAGRGELDPRTGEQLPIKALVCVCAPLAFHPLPLFLSFFPPHVYNRNTIYIQTVFFFLSSFLLSIVCVCARFSMHFINLVQTKVIQQPFRYSPARLSPAGPNVSLFTCSKFSLYKLENFDAPSFQLYGREREKKIVFFFFSRFTVIS